LNTAQDLDSNYGVGPRAKTRARLLIVKGAMDLIGDKIARKAGRTARDSDQLGAKQFL